MSSSSSVRFLSRRCFSTCNSAAAAAASSLEKYKYTLTVKTECYPPSRPLARAILYNPKHRKIAEHVIRLQPMGYPVVLEAYSIEQCRAWVLENFRFVKYLRIEAPQSAVDFLNADKILKIKQSLAKRAAGGGGGIFQYYFNRAAGSRGEEGGGGGGGPIVPYALNEEETEENKEASEGESDD